MLEKGARAWLALCSLVLAACGAKTLDFSGPDGGTGGSGNGMDGGITTAGGGGSGGEAGTGGATGGSGGTIPPPFVTTSLRNTKPNKIDLLFMIDNSSSMADKQAILATAVPDLVDRLINPQCLDPVSGRPLANPVNGVCPPGSELPYQPVNDIHIGIISSSLGNHGASGVCEDAQDTNMGRTNPHNDDRAHLLTRGPAGAAVPTFSNKGFLYYNPSAAGGLATSQQVAEPFKSLVTGVGQHGCGYEASLEAVYRFLVDPDPYDTIRIDTSTGGFGQALLNGTDLQLLQQRADFLRPDSLVSVVLVTDENDCSIIDGGQGFYSILPPAPGTGRSILMPGTSICKTNPNDTCCFNCGVLQPPPGCAPAQNDPECQGSGLSVVDDQPNLRCFNQKQRYGADFLYPVSRYIDGFSKVQVLNRKGDLVDNPLFADLTCQPGGVCAPARDPGLVVVTGIVGVPWQDLAVDPTDLLNGYKTPAQMRDTGTWAKVIGDPLNAAGPVPPADSHMVESIKPRAGLPGPESGPNADPIHGHEWDPTLDAAQPNADLQYACIFDLNPIKICIEAQDCDCFGAQSDLTLLHKPLCQNAGGAYTNNQVRAKAYPGTRILQVLQGLGDQGAAASICPAQTTAPDNDDYGYRPAMSAILNRLRNPLKGACMPQVLPINPTTRQTACSVIEVFNDTTCSCDTEPGRRTAPDALITPEMRSKGSCRCEITQLSGTALGACKATLNPPTNIGTGWCYVDPAQDSGASCDVVRSCPIETKRQIQFLNVVSEPRPGATAFLRCETPPLTTTPPAVCQ